MLCLTAFDFDPYLLRHVLMAWGSGGILTGSFNFSS